MAEMATEVMAMMESATETLHRATVRGEG